MRKTLLKLRKYFWFQYLISEWHVVMSRLNPLLYSDEKAIIKYYKKKSGGMTVDLNDPKTFSEKQQWYKLNRHSELMEQCADKYTVRQYIKDCGYGHLLNDLLGVYDSVDQIDLDKLPEKFVLKATHGSGFNLIVKEKGAVNWRRQKKMMRSWMRQDIYWSGREWVYKNLAHRIIAEKYLEDSSGGLLDYKFFCFNGKPSFMQLEVGRYTKDNTRNFYDTEWNLLPFGKDLPHNPDIHIEKPENFEEMKKIAEKLSKPFQFVRVDLYQVQGKVYFGELTFFPAGGAPDFIPGEYDGIIGEMWDITK